MSSNKPAQAAVSSAAEKKQSRRTNQQIFNNLTSKIEVEQAKQEAKEAAIKAKREELEAAKTKLDAVKLAKALKQTLKASESSGNNSIINRI